MSTQADLLATLNHERMVLLDALQELPDEVLTFTGIVGTWSIKQLLAHLADQERLVVQVLPQRLATGTVPDIVPIINADADTWNARQIAASEHLTLHEQRMHLEGARQALIHLIYNLGEEALNREHPWPEWSGTIAAYIFQVVGEHEREHRKVLLAALKTHLQTKQPAVHKQV